MKNYLFLLLYFTLTIHFVNAKKWETIQQGAWQSNSIWKGGIIPPYHSSDTFIIQHPVVIDSTLILDTNAYMLIDTLGGICGHQRVNLFDSAHMDVYGILDIDTIFLYGAEVMCLNPARVILTCYGILEHGSHMLITCSFRVGPWFECTLPEYAFIMGISNHNNLLDYSIAPNPFTNKTVLNFNTELIDARVFLYDEYGNLTKIMEHLSGHDIRIDKGNLPAGIYYLRIFNEHLLLESKKLFILNE